jgi:hypothetical protein
MYLLCSTVILSARRRRFTREPEGHFLAANCAPKNLTSATFRGRCLDCGNYVFAFTQLARSFIKLRAAAPADVEHFGRNDVVYGAADRILRVRM